MSVSIVISFVESTTVLCLSTIESMRFLIASAIFANLILCPQLQLFQREHPLRAPPQDYSNSTFLLHFLLRTASTLDMIVFVI